MFSDFFWAAPRRFSGSNGGASGRAFHYKRVCFKPFGVRCGGASWVAAPQRSSQVFNCRGFSLQSLLRKIVPQIRWLDSRSRTKKLGQAGFKRQKPILIAFLSLCLSAS